MADAQADAAAAGSDGGGELPRAAGAMPPEGEKMSLACLGRDMLGLLPSVLGRNVRKAVRDNMEDVFPLPNPWM